MTLKVKARKFVPRNLHSTLKRVKRYSYATFSTVCKSYIPVSWSNSAVFDGQAVHVIRTIDENSEYTRPPVFPEEIDIASMNPLKAQNKITLVETAAGSGFSFRNNHLLDAALNVYYEPGMQFANLPIYHQPLGKPEKLNGVIAYLSNTDTTNYYHWLCLTLPLLGMYRKYYDLDHIPYFYFGAGPLLPFHIESLARAGIPREKIIQKPCSADTLIAAFSERKPFNGFSPVTEANFRFTRELFAGSAQVEITAGKRLYVKRGNVTQRKVLNEEDIIELLKPLGFEEVAMDGLSIQQQAELFAAAEFIIAPHGAALTNLLFIRPGTVVVELMPDGYSHNCFYTLANYAGARYSYLKGKNLRNVQAEAKYGEGNKLDIMLDLEKLQAICDHYLN